MPRIKAPKEYKKKKKKNKSIPHGSYGNRKGKSKYYKMLEEAAKDPNKGTTDRYFEDIEGG